MEALSQLGAGSPNLLASTFSAITSEHSAQPWCVPLADIDKGPGGHLNPAEMYPVFAANGSCRSIDMGPNNETFAVASSDGLVTLWDLDELTCVNSHMRVQTACRVCSDAIVAPGTSSSAVTHSDGSPRTAVSPASASLEAGATNATALISAACATAKLTSAPTAAPKAPAATLLWSTVKSAIITSLFTYASAAARSADTTTMNPASAIRCRSGAHSESERKRRTGSGVPERKGTHMQGMPLGP